MSHKPNSIFEAASKVLFPEDHQLDEASMAIQLSELNIIRGIIEKCQDYFKTNTPLAKRFEKQIGPIAKTHFDKMQHHAQQMSKIWEDIEYQLDSSDS